MSTIPQQFKLKMQTERTNLHVDHMRYIEDLFKSGRISQEEKDQMLIDLHKVWK